MATNNFEQNDNVSVSQELQYYKRLQIIPHIAETLRVALMSDSKFKIGYDTIVPPNDNQPAELHPDIEPPNDNAAEFPYVRELGHRILDISNSELALV